MSETRSVLVTNVRHFVGLPSAKALLADGAAVFCHDAAFADAGKRAAFAAAHPGLRPLAEQAPKELVAAVVQAQGRLDAVVSNDAFPAIRGPIAEAKLEDLRASLEALTVFPFALAQAAVPQFRRQGGGRLLFVTSAGPLRGLPNYSMYATARGATNALALSLAKELAGDNIQVNAIAPNYVESPTYFPPALLADPKARAKMESNIPLRRLGKPEEVAALIAFFASDKCGFVTGHVLPVAGGWA